MPPNLRIFLHIHTYIHIPAPHTSSRIGVYGSRNSLPLLLSGVHPPPPRNVALCARIRVCAGATESYPHKPQAQGQRGPTSPQQHSRRRTAAPPRPYTYTAYCMVYGTKTGDRRGGRILRNSSIAIVLQPCEQRRWGGAIKGGLIRAQKPRRKRIYL